MPGSYHNPPPHDPRRHASRGARRVDWLIDFVPLDFPVANVFKYGHNANWFLRAPNTGPKQAAQFLLDELRAQKSVSHYFCITLAALTSLKHRPVILIGHSYGGIIVKEVAQALQFLIDNLFANQRQAICMACHDYQDIWPRLRGIIFFGTPHQGSRQSAVATALALLTSFFFASSTTLTTYLTYNGEQLTDLDRRFWKVWHGGIRLWSLLETMPTYFLGFFPVGLVVEKNAATVAMGQYREVWTNHSGLNKYTSNQSELYKYLKQAIQDIADSVQASAPPGTRGLSPGTGILKRIGDHTSLGPAITAFQTPSITSIISRHLTMTDGTGNTRPFLSHGRPASADHTQFQSIEIADFYTYDYQRDLKTMKDRVCAGTCAWITSTSDYLWWLRAGPSKLLWLTGDPGLGKSCLMTHIITCLSSSTKQEVSTGMTEAAVLYSFCREQVNHTGSFVLSTALHQLLLEYPETRKVANDWDKERVISGRPAAPGKLRPMNTLWRMLCDVVDASHLPRVYLLIDGLDECDRQSQDDLMELFLSRSDKLNILVSSQPSEQRRIYMLRKHGSEHSRSLYRHFDANKSYLVVNDALGLFIDIEVKLLAEAKRWTVDELQSITAQLLKRRNGLFLPIDLTIRQLEKVGHSVDIVQLDAIFDDLEGLDSRYSKMIEDVPRVLRQKPSRVLEFMLYTLRPLTLTELAVACHFLEDGKLLTATSGSPSLLNRVERLRRHLAIYGPIFRVVPPNNVVEFYHLSAKTFLLQRAPPKDKTYYPFIVAEHQAQMDIASACLAFLITRSGEAYPEKWNDNYAARASIPRGVLLHGYAMAYWHVHVRRAIQFATELSLDQSELAYKLEKLRLITRDESRSVFARKVLKGLGRDGEELIPALISRLEFYTWLNHTAIVDTILGPRNTGQDTSLVKCMVPIIHVRDAFKQAARSGHGAIFESLLGVVQSRSLGLQTIQPGISELLFPLFSNADATRDGVLVEAVRGGNVRIFRVLMGFYSAAPAEVATAIRLAIKRGDNDLLGEFANHKKALCVADSGGRTALHYLAPGLIKDKLSDLRSPVDMELYMDAVQFLVDADLNLQKKDVYGNTPLHYICLDKEQCTTLMVRKYMELGADPTAQNNLGQTVVHYAAYRGSHGAVLELLDAPFPRAALTSSHGGLTPLHWAMQRGFDLGPGGYKDYKSGTNAQHIVTELLCRGADFGAVSRWGRSPLTIARENPTIWGDISSLTVRLEGGHVSSGADLVGYFIKEEYDKQYELARSRFPIEEVLDSSESSPVHESSLGDEYTRDIGLRRQRGWRAR
ncbi:hypothetical protein LTR62_005631 [Meristemomyces frigidus]|uniref:Nephrocystin 3-like N-terminal domain-containing protein n=1 Tax=Meristemomyces frigidus TaxID=1508187 RepID=A0AAN7TKQ5_9PEZI|nr:hypothetical protein LTR62_005631 [Meristemomyces frigidus]